MTGERNLDLARTNPLTRENNMYLQPDHKEIKRIMANRGLSVVDVANRAKINKSTIMRIASGKQNAQVAKLQAVARALSVSLDQITVCN